MSEEKNTVDFTPEQQEAIKALDANVAVSAGAGSGKTKVLVARFMYILEQSLAQKKPLEAMNILAITFTRKAAGEMKTRIRQSISEKINIDTLNANFWRTQLQNIERAQITTIHGLCSRMLRENPVEAQLDPNFTVAEEFEGRQFVEDALQRYLRRELRQGNEPLRRLINIYGAASFTEQVRQLLPQLADIAQEISGAGRALTQPYKEYLAACPGVKQDLCLALQELVDQREQLTSKTSKGRQCLNALAELWPQVQQELGREKPDFTTLDAALSGLNAAGKVKPLLLEIREARQKLEQSAIMEAALPLVEDWQTVLGELAAYITEMKSQQELLTFDDLELQALELLQNNADVRKKYHDRFRYIMVDEFQDTNERQRQLIYLLCGDSMTELEGKKLFIVGDAKQSIYRFRGAEVRVFAEVQREMRDNGGKLLKLTKNFRSIKGVLTACNVAFKQLLGEDRSRDVYFEALEHHKDAVIEPVLLEVPYEKEQKALRRTLEAEAIAQRMRLLHDKEQVSYGEMTVLLEAMTECAVLTAALERSNVPYVIVDGKGFYERQEVLDLLHLLTVLHNRYRSLELAGVLRSPYFGLSDETLTQLFLGEAESLWQALQKADLAQFASEQAKRIERARTLLAQLASYAALYALPELLAEIWRLLAVDAVLSVQAHGKSKLANACKLRDEAVAYCAGRQAGLGDWLNYVQAMRDTGARATTANLEAEEAVQIMTIHKSKGLEFNTVFLPQLDRKGQNDTSSIKYNKSLGLGIKAPQDDGVLVSTPILDKIKEADKELEREEYVRKLYVAMTRAEERLYMSGAVEGSYIELEDEGRSFSIKKKREKPLAQKRWLEQLMEIFSETGTGVRVELAEAGAEETEERAEQKPFNVTDEMKERIAPLPTFCCNGRSCFTASALQTYLHCERQYYYQQVLELPALEETNCVGGEGGACDVLPAYVTGLIVHRALELYRGGDGETALAKAISEQEVEAESAKVARYLFEKYLASDLFKSLPAEHRREQKFVLPEDGLMLEGVIDYLADTPEGLVLVDYKTGTPPETEAVHLGYAYQLALYKKAAERMYGKRVIRAELHFLQNLSKWELSPSADYLQEAVALCKKIAGKCAVEDFGCNSGRACSYCPYVYICPQENR